MIVMGCGVADDDKDEPDKENGDRSERSIESRFQYLTEIANSYFTIELSEINDLIKLIKEYEKENKNLDPSFVQLLESIKSEKVTVKDLAILQAKISEQFPLFIDETVKRKASKINDTYTQSLRQYAHYCLKEHATNIYAIVSGIELYLQIDLRHGKSDIEIFEREQFEKLQSQFLELIQYYEKNKALSVDSLDALEKTMQSINTKRTELSQPTQDIVSSVRKTIISIKQAERNRKKLQSLTVPKDLYDEGIGIYMKQNEVGKRVSIELRLDLGNERCENLIASLTNGREVGAIIQELNDKADEIRRLGSESLGFKEKNKLKKIEQLLHFYQKLDAYHQNGSEQWVEIAGIINLHKELWPEMKWENAKYLNDLIVKIGRFKTSLFDVGGYIEANKSTQEMASEHQGVMVAKYNQQLVFATGKGHCSGFTRNFTDLFRKQVFQTRDPVAQIDMIHQLSADALKRTLEQNVENKDNVPLFYGVNTLDTSEYIAALQHQQSTDIFSSSEVMRPIHRPSSGYQEHAEDLGQSIIRKLHEGMPFDLYLTLAGRDAAHAIFVAHDENGYWLIDSHYGAFYFDKSIEGQAENFSDFINKFAEKNYPDFKQFSLSRLRDLPSASLNTETVASTPKTVKPEIRTRISRLIDRKFPFRPSNRFHRLRERLSSTRRMATESVVKSDGVVSASNQQQAAQTKDSKVTSVTESSSGQQQVLQNEDITETPVTGSVKEISKDASRSGVPLNVSLSEAGYAKFEAYLNHHVKNDPPDIGARLAYVLKDSNLAKLTVEELVDALLKTKRPKLFAEGTGDWNCNTGDWTSDEFKLLGLISYTMELEAYAHETAGQINVLDTLNPIKAGFAHAACLGGHAVDKNDILKDVYTMQEGKPVFNREQLKMNMTKYYEDRLVSLLKNFNDSADPKNGIVVTLPMLGVGAFAGQDLEVKTALGQLMPEVYQTIIEKHAANLPNIKGVVIDKYNPAALTETEKQPDRKWGHIQIKSIASSTPPPGFLAPPKEMFSDNPILHQCEQAVVLAGDHLSLPGNDMYINSDMTQEGGVSSRVNLLEKVTGHQGEMVNGKFLPKGENHRNWEDCFEEQRASNQLRLNQLQVVKTNGRTVIKKVTPNSSIYKPKSLHGLWKANYVAKFLLLNQFLKQSNIEPLKQYEIEDLHQATQAVLEKNDPNVTRAYYQFLQEHIFSVFNRADERSQINAQMMKYLYPDIKVNENGYVSFEAFLDFVEKSATKKDEEHLVLREILIKDYQIATQLPPAQINELTNLINKTNANHADYPELFEFQILSKLKQVQQNEQKRGVYILTNLVMGKGISREKLENYLTTHEFKQEQSTAILKDYDELQQSISDIRKDTVIQWDNFSQILNTIKVMNPFELNFQQKANILDFISQPFGIHYADAQSGEEFIKNLLIEAAKVADLSSDYELFKFSQTLPALLEKVEIPDLPADKKKMLIKQVTNQTGRAYTSTSTSNLYYMQKAEICAQILAADSNDLSFAEKISAFYHGVMGVKGFDVDRFEQALRKHPLVDEEWVDYTIKHLRVFQHSLVTQKTTPQSLSHSSYQRVTIDTFMSRQSSWVQNLDLSSKNKKDYQQHLSDVAKAFKGQAIDQIKKIQIGDLHDQVVKTGSSAVCSDIAKHVDKIVDSVQRDILYGQTKEERAQMIKFYLDLAHVCIQQNDAYTAQAIMSALNKKSVVCMSDEIQLAATLPPHVADSHRYQLNTAQFFELNVTLKMQHDQGKTFNFADLGQGSEKNWSLIRANKSEQVAVHLGPFWLDLNSIADSNGAQLTKDAQYEKWITEFLSWQAGLQKVELQDAQRQYLDSMNIEMMPSQEQISQIKGTSAKEQASEFREMINQAFATRRIDLLHGKIDDALGEMMNLAANKPTRFLSMNSKIEQCLRDIEREQKNNGYYFDDVFKNIVGHPSHQTILTKLDALDFNSPNGELWFSIRSPQIYHLVTATRQLDNTDGNAVNQHFNRMVEHIQSIQDINQLNVQEQLQLVDCCLQCIGHFGGKIDGAAQENQTKIRVLEHFLNHIPVNQTTYMPSEAPKEEKRVLVNFLAFARDIDNYALDRKSLERERSHLPEGSGKHPQTIWQVLGERGQAKLYEGAQVTPDKSKRLEMLKCLQDRYQTVQVRQDNPKYREKRNIQDKAISIEELLGKEGAKLYRQAIQEEGASRNFRDAVLNDSTIEVEGPRFAKKLRLLIGGPSGAGKSFTLKFLLDKIQKDGILGQKNTGEQGNYVLAVDGGKERELSQMRQLVVQLALEKGYSGVSDIHENTKLNVKKQIEKAGHSSDEVSVVIPATFVSNLIKSIKQIRAVAKDDNVVQVMAEVRGEDGKPGSFRATVRNNALNRAWRMSESYFGKLGINVGLECESKAPQSQYFSLGKWASKLAKYAYVKATKNPYVYEVPNDRIFICATRAGWRECKYNEISDLALSRRDFEQFKHATSPDKPETMTALYFRQWMEKNRASLAKLQVILCPTNYLEVKLSQQLSHVLKEEGLLKRPLTKIHHFYLKAELHEVEQYMDTVYRANANGQSLSYDESQILMYQALGLLMNEKVKLSEPVKLAIEAERESIQQALETRYQQRQEPMPDLNAGLPVYIALPKNIQKESLFSAKRAIHAATGKFHKELKTDILAEININTTRIARAVKIKVSDVVEKSPIGMLSYRFRSIASVSKNQQRSGFNLTDDERKPEFQEKLQSLIQAHQAMFGSLEIHETYHKQEVQEKIVQLADKLNNYKKDASVENRLELRRAIAEAKGAEEREVREYAGNIEKTIDQLRQVALSEFKATVGTESSKESMSHTSSTSPGNPSKRH